MTPAVRLKGRRRAARDGQQFSVAMRPTLVGTHVHVLLTLTGKLGRRLAAERPEDTGFRRRQVKVTGGSCGPVGGGIWPGLLAAKLLCPARRRDSCPAAAGGTAE